MIVTPKITPGLELERQLLDAIANDQPTRALAILDQIEAQDREETPCPPSP